MAAIGELKQFGAECVQPWRSFREDHLMGFDESRHRNETGDLVFYGFLPVKEHARLVMEILQEAGAGRHILNEDALGPMPEELRFDGAFQIRIVQLIPL